jgi:hypothetical protein
MPYDIDELLGGAKRKRTRKRGFVSWRPQAKSQVLLDQVQQVLAEYADHLPLSVRQIYYRMVAVHGLPKTEAASDTLEGILRRARRARIIPMEHIRDDDPDSLDTLGYSSVENFLANLRYQAESFQLDRTAGQPTRLVVWSEARGMKPQLEAVAEPYGIPVLSGGGFDSLTKKNTLAEDLADQERPTEVLHIGDHDPSGAHMFLSFAEDVVDLSKEYGGEVDFTRLAVTPPQIARYNLPTNPAKKTDRRAFKGPTTQAEALAPDELAAILRSAITARLDTRAYEKVLRAERAARRDLQTRLKWR